MEDAISNKIKDGLNSDFLKPFGTSELQNM